MVCDCVEEQKRSERGKCILQMVYVPSQCSTNQLRWHSFIVLNKCFWWFSLSVSVCVCVYVGDIIGIQFFTCLHCRWHACSISEQDFEFSENCKWPKQIEMCVHTEWDRLHSTGNTIIHMIVEVENVLYARLLGLHIYKCPALNCQQNINLNRSISGRWSRVEWYIFSNRKRINKLRWVSSLSHTYSFRMPIHIYPVNEENVDSVLTPYISIRNIRIRTRSIDRTKVKNGM